MCRNCVASGAKCTFFNESTTHGQSKAYVSALEQKLESMEELLRKLSLRVDIEAELAQHMSDSPPERPIMATVLRSAGTIDLGPLKTRGREDLSSCFGRDYEVEFESSGSDDDDGLPERITKTLQEFNMTESPTLFHGKSSGFRLLRAATLLKKEQGIQPSPNPTPQPQMSSEWERRLMEAPPPSEFTFPPDDLIRVLFDLFFLHFTPFLPVLHQPTFEAQYRSGLHLKNTSFAKSVLLVCAIASRYCEDPRVCFEEIGRQSAGWRYFIQVGDLKRPAYVSATLNDIQCYVMLAYFLQTTCAHNAAWTVVGNGIRAAQDIGMHRRRAGKGPISLYDEQQKRAFWCLVTIDAYMSAILGRPMAYHDEDFDLDLPVEVDDEYWPLPNQDGSIATPTQPDGLPSKISFFVTYVKLNQIIGFMLRTIYSFNKNKALLGFGGEKWDQLVVSELDSRMNKLLDSVPEHLKWDANRQNDVHFMQSSMLYASCYMWQIFIHRPFIHSIKGPSTLSFPSMSICTNAARSCSHVLEAVQNRKMRTPAPLLGAAINSGIVLLMALWSASKTGVSIDCQATMRDVNQCISFLKACNEE
ncbi:hypothetical protein DL93DRAFT_2078902 [Clavulina sp. PMI_390]|nr:hypothetical protein DL93DRAFT_2078902 [Clavulina sp. PMI_390]